MAKNKITINGQTFEVDGNNVNIQNINGNNNIQVNGMDIVKNVRGNVHITWEGELANLNCTSCTINGDIKGDVDCTSANITGNVGGDVDGTSISCGDVAGSVDGTTINCKSIGKK